MRRATSATCELIKEGEVLIVDEFTGRIMPGRRWSDGLHQAIEAKEGVTVENENQPDRSCGVKVGLNLCNLRGWFRWAATTCQNGHNSRVDAALKPLVWVATSREGGRALHAVEKEKSDEKGK